MSFDQIFMGRIPYKSEPSSKFLFFDLGFQRALKIFFDFRSFRVTDSNFQSNFFFRFPGFYPCGIGEIQEIMDVNASKPSLSIVTVAWLAVGVVRKEKEENRASPCE